MEQLLKYEGNPCGWIPVEIDVKIFSALRKVSRVLLYSI